MDTRALADKTLAASCLLVGRSRNLYDRLTLEPAPAPGTDQIGRSRTLG
jgi:hypothetical protein